MNCCVCGKVFSGEGPTVTIEGEKRTYCADCFWQLRVDYDKKKTCDSCAYFFDDSCEKTGKAIVPISIGIRDYFVQAETCGQYSSEKEGSAAINENRNSRIKKLEKAGRYEEAAREYEKLGMLENAGLIRKKEKKITVPPTDLDALMKKLTERGQTLTYYCPHCGTGLKIGAKSAKILKTCPKCGQDLEIIDMDKFINQHLS
jgi:hypothetical protein